MLCTICLLTTLGNFYRIPEKSPKSSADKMNRAYEQNDQTLIRDFVKALETTTAMKRRNLYLVALWPAILRFAAAWRPYPDPPILAFLEKQGFSPKKQGFFLFAEPLKSLEKRGKAHKKARKIGKQKKQGNRKKQGLEGRVILRLRPAGLRFEEFRSPVKRGGLGLRFSNRSGLRPAAI